MISKSNPDYSYHLNTTLMGVAVHCTVCNVHCAVYDDILYCKMKVTHFLVSENSSCRIRHLKI